MKNVVWKKGIINTLLGDSGANVALAAATGTLPALAYICSDAASTGGNPWTLVGNPAVIFPPIPYGSVTKIEKIVSAAEVRQIAVLGIDTEVIVLSTRYKIEIGNAAERYEGAATPLQPYAYTSPAVLSGNAQTDRNNVYTVLNSKINARNNHVTSYLMYVVAFTTGGSVGGAHKNFVIGEVVTQETSFATAQVAACVITSGTMADGNAAGNIYLYNITGTWSAAAKYIEGADGAGKTNCKVTTNAALAIQGLVIVDDAGYYPSNPSMRRGPSSVITSYGFTLAHFDVGVSTATTEATKIGLTGVISRGIGAHLLTDVPTFNADKTDYASGDASFVVNAAPVSGTNYTQLNIHISSNAVWSSLVPAEFGDQYILVLYIQEDSGLTNHALFLTALAYATGVTPA